MDQQAIEETAGMEQPRQRAPVTQKGNRAIMPYRRLGFLFLALSLFPAYAFSDQAAPIVREETIQKATPPAGGEVPQRPEYKALEMKPQYEGPRDPVVEEPLAAPAEKTMLMETGLDLTVQVNDLEASLGEIEKAVTEEGGTTISSESFPGKKVILAQIASSKEEELLNRLSSVGVVKMNGPSGAKEEQLLVKIEITTGMQD